jgi:glycosyltransferase 2 family protein
VAIIIFALAAVVLWSVATSINMADVQKAVVATTREQLFAALGLTILSYLLLTSYDALALRQLRLRIKYRITALASFTSYAVSFNLGFPLLTGGAIRHWIYAPKGVRTAHIASLTVIAGITFWLGLSLVLGACLLWEASALAKLTSSSWLSENVIRLFGLVALSNAGGYMIWVGIRRRIISVKGWRLRLPGIRLTTAQMLIGAVDVCIGAGVLYALLPTNHGLSFEMFLAVYVFAVMLGILSHSPGGIGVFEATMLLALSALSRESVLSALLLFRLCYYLLPLLVALVMLAVYEIRHRVRVARLTLGDG